MVTISLPVLIVGAIGRSEFCGIDTLFPSDVFVAEDVPGALAAIETGYTPALMVVLQAWPGQFSALEFDRLRRACPLARVVRVLGPWMEGELRTGRPVVGTAKVYWHETAAYIARELKQLVTGGKSSWSLPITASEQDRLIENQADLIRTNHNNVSNVFNKSIAIYANHWETAEALTDICKTFGWQGHWLWELDAALVKRFDAVVVDATRGASCAAAVLRKLQSIGCSPPTIALVGFSRLDEIDQLRSAGALAVLRKPFSIDDIRWHLDRVLGT